MKCIVHYSIHQLLFPFPFQFQFLVYNILNLTSSKFLPLGIKRSSTNLQSVRSNLMFSSFSEIIIAQLWRSGERASNTPRSLTAILIESKNAPPDYLCLRVTRQLLGTGSTGFRSAWKLSEQVNLSHISKSYQLGDKLILTYTATQFYCPSYHRLQTLTRPTEVNRTQEENDIFSRLRGKCLEISEEDFWYFCSSPIGKYEADIDIPTYTPLFGICQVRNHLQKNLSTFLCLLFSLKYFIVLTLWRHKSNCSQFSKDRSLWIFKDNFYSQTIEISTWPSLECLHVSVVRVVTRPSCGHPVGCSQGLRTS